MMSTVHERSKLQTGSLTRRSIQELLKYIKICYIKKEDCLHSVYCSMYCMKVLQVSKIQYTVKIGATFSSITKQNFFPVINIVAVQRVYCIQNHQFLFREYSVYKIISFCSESTGILYTIHTKSQGNKNLPLNRFSNF